MPADDDSGESTGFAATAPLDDAEKQRSNGSLIAIIVRWERVFADGDRPKSSSAVAVDIQAVAPRWRWGESAAATRGVLAFGGGEGLKTPVKSVRG